MNYYKTEEHASTQQDKFSFECTQPFSSVTIIMVAGKWDAGDLMDALFAMVSVLHFINECLQIYSLIFKDLESRTNVQRQQTWKRQFWTIFLLTDVIHKVLALNTLVTTS